MRISSYVLLAAFSITYYALIASGLLSTKPPLPEYALYALPILNASFVALLISFYGALTSRKGTRIVCWAWFVAMVLFCAGYWGNAMSSSVSSFVITEGQAVDSEYIQRFGTESYLGKRSAASAMDIRLLSIEDAMRKEGGHDSRKARFLLDNREILFEEGKSAEYQDMHMRISGFGYSPRYELVKDGMLLDSAFVSLDIHPPGREDSFMMISPHVYYIRYYPAEGGSSAYYRLRVARNKHLIYNGRLAPAEVAMVEDSEISFPETRQWTEVTLRREPGAGLMLAGIVLGACALILAILDHPKAH